MPEPDRTDIMNRLKLIEEMIAEGRQSTERWGWAFLLWGIAPLIAMVWESRWPHAALAWPVMIATGAVVNGWVVRVRNRRGRVETVTTRAVGAVWSSAGITVLLLAVAAVWSGGPDIRAVYAGSFALAAVAHGTSSIILRWLPQLLAALVWWFATVAAFVVPAARLHDLAMAALLFGNVVFGAWLAYREWSREGE